MSSSKPWRCDIAGSDYCVRQFTVTPVVTVAIQFLLYGTFFKFRQHIKIHRALFSGSYAVLYGICIFFLTKRKRHRYILHCIAISALFLLATVGLVTNTVNAAAYAAFMFHESAPMDSLEASQKSGQDLMKTIGNTGVVAVIVYVVANMIGDAILLWRCYHIWGSRLKIIILPTLLCLGSNTLAITDSVLADPLKPEFDGEGSFYSLSPPKLLISFLFVTMFANAILTLMIAGRIFYITRQAMRLLGSHVRRTYKTIIALILESGMLYPFALILYATVLISMWVKGTTGSGGASSKSQVATDLIAQVMAYSLVQFVGIAPTLIIVRTGLGISVENVESTVQTIRVELTEQEISPEIHRASRIAFRHSLRSTDPTSSDVENLELQIPQSKSMRVSS
ncbi:hypothetical protein WG66_000193 [Moniliophthora roreri]|nr:hypothetical protein WG66_000193 [Moniliophthora roreri]